MITAEELRRYKKSINRFEKRLVKAQKMGNTEITELLKPWEKKMMENLGYKVIYEPLMNTLTTPPSDDLPSYYTISWAEE